VTEYETRQIVIPSNHIIPAHRFLIHHIENAGEIGSPEQCYQ